MKVKPFKDKIRKFSAVGMPCTAKEFNDLKKGKEIALPKDVAEEMSAMGLVKTIEQNKPKRKEK
tara:strand:- start:178 stop:369 length:192 start_codon:yes stop_codon:yes gene_type:complete